MSENSEMIITLEKSSKKDRLTPRPQIEEELLPPSKKMKTSNPTSKVRLSEKKQEVTVREDAVEIIETNCIEISGNETPSKRSFKPVSDHVKTPFSKIKENEEDAGTPIKSSTKNIEDEKIEQPNFSEEKKSSAQKEALSVDKIENGSTKSSLIKIIECEAEKDGKVTEEQPDPALDTTAISQKSVDAN